jgi:hypothetical protein
VSWLLSELSKVVAKSFADTYGFDKLIFPSPNDKNLLVSGQAFNVPNKIMAEFEQFDPKITLEIKKAMDLFLSDLWIDAKKQIKDPLDTNDLAEKQILDIVEFY